MAYSFSEKRTINSVTFKIIVKEGDNYRRIEVINDDKQIHRKILRDKIEEKEPSWFDRTFLNVEPVELPDRSEHVSRVFNKAVSKQFEEYREYFERQKEIEQALDISEEVITDE